VKLVLRQRFPKCLNGFQSVKYGVFIKIVKLRNSITSFGLDELSDRHMVTSLLSFEHTEKKMQVGVCLASVNLCTYQVERYMWMEYNRWY
jgi:hypothetical protein